MTSSIVARHQPCPDCGSSDALSAYDDGHTYCFSCETLNNSNVIPITQHKEQSKMTFTTPPGKIRSIPERNIGKATAEAYGCYSDGENYHFVYRDAAGTEVGAKMRTPEKKFPQVGDMKSAVLYGAHLFAKGGKYVTITEGEFDAMAAFEMTGSKWPVVSIKNGAQSALKDCRAAYEYLDSFEHVIICFDNDEAGHKAAAKVAELFGGKAKVVKLKRKDANEYHIAGESKEFTDTWWRAEQYVPDGIVNGAGLWDEVSEPVASAKVMYPFEGLNALTYGIREGELVVISAGSGLGKSQVVGEIVYHVLEKTKENVGVLFLEEGRKRTALRIMSLAAGLPLHLPTTVCSEEDRREAFDKTLGTGRVYLFDHFGSTGIDNIVSRVRYMAKALDCRYIFLDHVSIVISAQENGDERKALDEIMTKLRMLVQETNIALFAVSHLKRPDGKGHEEGAATSLSQLRGSGAIGQLSDMVIGLERNGQAEDIVDRNTTRVRVLKNRFAGVTGPACNLLYNHETGRLLEVVEDPTL